MTDRQYTILKYYNCMNPVKTTALIMICQKQLECSVINKVIYCPNSVMYIIHRTYKVACPVNCKSK